MRVLLVGDYSGVHLNLSKGLAELGHDVMLVSAGDGFKKIPSDYYWKVCVSGKISRLLGIHDSEFILRNKELIDLMSGFDIVQIVNPVIVDECSISNNSILFDILRRKNSKVFLYSCGDDLNWVSACLSTASYQSMFQDSRLYLSREIVHPIKYLANPAIRRLSKKIYSEVDAIIPGSFDYDWCLGLGVEHEIIPFPVDFSPFEFKPLESKEVYQIMHGVQPGKSLRKGDEFFEKAVRMIKGFSYERVCGVPYVEYLKKINNCDVFFDQVYSRDQGMNALYAMACGKVVFSGFSEYFYKGYGLIDPVGINALPSHLDIVDKLRRISDGEIDVEKISQNARKFVVHQHDKTKVAHSFIKRWSGN
ncbi:hypothetical protein [Deefgea salmonis]|uniref:Glycosyltransferase n=1 Tax=Deefgea salmonis TaxID=2875502 RepID=A0ABS8BKP7_9NEIS|nr:hypothetical protein [Deefgea salmonis]MCB5196116.1 hypothetical protein [Deefgea salmonis]